MSIKSVAASKAGIKVTPRNSYGGRGAYDAQGLANGSFYAEDEVSFDDRLVAVSTGFSSGMLLPLPFKRRRGICFGTPMTQAVWDALATDDLRDNAFVTTDEEFPVGSELVSFHPTLKPGAVAGGFAGIVWSGIPVKEYPQGIMLKCMTTPGAPGTALISCSSDGGTTWCTAYATEASALNVVKDSSTTAGVDTGLRIRLGTSPNFTTDDRATLDLKAPGSCKKWLKTAPDTWVNLTL